MHQFHFGVKDQITLSEPTATSCVCTRTDRSTQFEEEISVILSHLSLDLKESSWCL